MYNLANSCTKLNIKNYFERLNSHCNFIYQTESIIAPIRILNIISKLKEYCMVTN